MPTTSCSSDARREPAEPTFTGDQSALVIPVPEAEPLVGALRQRHDPAAALGIPAHVTVVFPFLPGPRLDDEVVAELGALFARQGPLEVTFVRTARFPACLYLEPEFSEPFNALTGLVFERWPEAPPYGGRFTDLVPHLTVADRAEVGVLDAVEARLTPRLPLVSSLREACLFVFDGARWQLRARFPFGGEPAPR